MHEIKNHFMTKVAYSTIHTSEQIMVVAPSILNMFIAD